jgi:hypothetical protein
MDLRGRNVAGGLGGGSMQDQPAGASRRACWCCADGRYVIWSHLDSIGSDLMQVEKFQ